MLCVCVCGGGYCNVWVCACVSFVICGCFGNMCTSIYCLILFMFCIFILCILLFNFVSYVFLCYVYISLLLRVFCSVYSVFNVPTGTVRLP